MGAQDYMVGSAPQPTSYASPLIGFQLGQQLADLPNSYFKGTQQKRTLDLQKPVIDPATGQPTMNPNIVVPELMKRGGADYAKELLPMVYGAEADRKVGDLLGGGQPQQAPQTVAPNSAPATGPANLRPQPQTAGPPPAQPQLSSAGVDNAGPQTVNSMASEVFGGRDVTPMLPRFAAAVGNKLGEPLTPEQATRLLPIMKRSAQSAPQADASSTAGAAPNARGSEPPFARGAPPPNDNAAAPPAQPAAAPAGVQKAPGAAGDPTLGGLVPKGQDPAGYRNALAQAASSRFLSPGAKEAALTRMKAIDEYISKSGLQAQEAALKAKEPTPEMKNAVASGAANPMQYEGRKEEQKNEIVQSQKTYNGIQAQSSQYERDLKPYLSLSRSILSQPEMYTGTGANTVLDFNKLKSIYGDKKAAMLQEALSKVTASSVLGQINTQRDQLMEAGGASSRIFAQQVDLVEKAAPALSNTRYGNIFLVEVANRMGELSARVAQMSRDYVREHGHLDPGFDQHIADYMKQHPVFSEKELTHPELLGAPTVPSVKGAAEWAKKMGLNPGDPVRLHNGDVKYWQGKPHG